jgi:hypothetical protein
LRKTAAALVFGFAVWLAIRAGWGKVADRAYVNIASATGVAFVLCLLAGSRTRAIAVCGQAGGVGKVVLLLLPVVAIPYLLTLHSPLLHDAGAHVVRASRESWQDAAATFYRHPVSGDFFFRPVGYLDYWTEAQWAGTAITRWNALNISWHLAATALLFALCREIGMSLGASVAACLLFGLHGSNPETVVWTAARFDELAAAFALASLVLVARATREVGWTAIALSVAAGVAAFGSKEAAFCLPALALGVLAMRGPITRQGYRALAAVTVSAVTVFAYRLWVVGGVGGYRDAQGSATALQISGLHLMELMAFRMWSVLVVPVNWSVRAEPWLVVGTVLLGVSGVLFALGSRPSRRVILWSLATSVTALLPASHLALLDARLTGARVYHLALIGMALAFGWAYDGFRSQRVAVVAAGALLLFQTAALTHNLLIWRDTAALAGRVCRNFPELAGNADRVSIPSLPRLHNGVFFLGNGFSECVLLQTGRRLEIHTGPAVEATDGVGLDWSEREQRFVRKR